MATLDYRDGNVDHTIGFGARVGGCIALFISMLPWLCTAAFIMFPSILASTNTGRGSPFTLFPPLLALLGACLGLTAATIARGLERVLGFAAIAINAGYLTLFVLTFNVC